MTQATPIIAVAAALRAHLDKTHQYSFVKSLSNVAIDSVSGITYPRTWDLEDPDTEVGFINSHDVTSVIQHQGFRFWGSHTCSDNPEYMFEPVVRTSQFLLEYHHQWLFSIHRSTAITNDRARHHSCHQCQAARDD